MRSVYLYKHNSWQQDTQEQQAEMMLKLSPAPLNTMSVHVYQDNDVTQAGSVTASMIEDFDRDVSWYMQAAKAAGQGLFVGEFGIMDSVCDSRATAKKILEAQYNAFMKYGVQLSCIWVYGKSDGDPMDISPTNDLAYQYNLVVNANKQYREEGKQDTAAYWDNVTPLIYKANGSATTVTPKPTTTQKANATTTAAVAITTTTVTGDTQTTNQVVTSTTGTTLPVNTEPGEKASFPWGWVIGGIAAVLVVGGATAFCILKFKKKES